MQRDTAAVRRLLALKAALAHLNLQTPASGTAEPRVCPVFLLLEPQLTNANRVVEDAVLPLHKPIRGTDGKEITELVVRKGATIFISMLGCNRSRDLWGPDVLEWKPERWLSDLPKELVEAKVPGVYSNL